MLEKDGLVKLVEECGELIQVAAKKMTRMETDEHWDKVGSLKRRLEEEMGDVMAAIKVVSDNFDLDFDYMFNRAQEKEKLFIEWHNKPD
jgi:NTP pyrophosphatase (non-canonical NTP hydrolase)